jgi:hypothetical protein
MARAVKPEEDWIENFKNSRQTRAELEKMKVVLRKAAELRKHTNIAPLTTADLVRSVRDEQDENS